MLDWSDVGVSDADLVAAVRRGDQIAFETLYRRHSRAVTRVVAKQLRDSQRVTDGVQETFTRALEALPRLREPARFRPWLLSIASHTAIDAVRAECRIREEQFEDEFEQVDPALGPEALHEIAELAALVRGAVAGLSRRDATAVGLVALGFGPAEVARALGLSRGAAKVALHRARSRLRTALHMVMLVRQQAPACAAGTAAAKQGTLEFARHVAGCAECERSFDRALRAAQPAAG